MKDWQILAIVLLITGLILLAIGNWGYCIIRYWNTPHLEVPHHCFNNKS